MMLTSLGISIPYFELILHYAASNESSQGAMPNCMDMFHPVEATISRQLRASFILQYVIWGFCVPLEWFLSHELDCQRNNPGERRILSDISSSYWLVIIYSLILFLLQMSRASGFAPNGLDTTICWVSIIWVPAWNQGFMATGWP